MSADRYPTVDIIIAAKNEGHSIDKCLTALAEQDYPRDLIRVLVVDKGSIDGTRYLAKKHSATLLTNRTGTIGAARNTGIRNGKGTIIAFLDAHSIPEPDWLSQMVTCLQETQADVCQGVIRFEFRDDWLKHLAEQYGMSPDLQKERWWSGRWTAYPSLCTGNLACTRSSLEDIGLFDERFARAEDLDLSWRFILAGYSLSYCAQGKVLHTNTDGIIKHLLKHFYHGKALVLVINKYGLHGKNDSPDKRLPGSQNSPGTALVSLFIKAGYAFEGVKQKFGLALPAEPIQIEVRKKFRPYFFWTPEILYSLSEKTVFWHSDDNEFIVVNTATTSRFVFSDSSALIFENLINGSSRRITLDRLSYTYAVHSQSIESDVDEFINELLKQEILIDRSKSSQDSLK